MITLTNNDTACGDDEVDYDGNFFNKATCPVHVYNGGGHVGTI